MEQSHPDLRYPFRESISLIAQKYIQNTFNLGILRKT